MIDGTFDGKPSVITKGLQSFYPPKNFQGCPQKKRKYDDILSYLRYTVSKVVLPIQCAINIADKIEMRIVILIWKLCFLFTRHQNYWDAFVCLTFHPSKISNIPLKS